MKTWKWILKLVIPAGFFGMVCLLAGCDVYTAKTVQEMDQNATISDWAANKSAAGNMSREEEAYWLEVFRRAFRNLSDAGHFKAPTYKDAPTTMPTTLPWTPSGGLNPNK